MNCRCGKPIDDHEPGAELDSCVARYVMGWTVIDQTNVYPEIFRDEEESKTYTLYTRGIAFVDRFSPSTSIGDAWKVLQVFRDDPFSHRSATTFVDCIAEYYDANQNEFYADIYNLVMGLDAKGICRAALKAVGNGCK